MTRQTYVYRVDAYSDGKWTTLGYLRRPGPLLAAWKGARLGIWPSVVVRVPSPGVQKKPS